MSVTRYHSTKIGPKMPLMTLLSSPHHQIMLLAFPPHSVFCLGGGRRSGRSSPSFSTVGSGLG
jgi:hypothetical protein